MKKLLVLVILKIALQTSDALALEISKKKDLIWIECSYRNIKPEFMFELKDENTIFSLDLSNNAAVRHNSLGEEEKYKVEISGKNKDVLELTKEMLKDINRSGDEIGCRESVVLSRYGYYHWSSNCKYLPSIYEGRCKKINEPKPLF